MSRSLWLGKMFEGIGLGVGGDVRGGVGEMWGCVCLCVCVGGGGFLTCVMVSMDRGGNWGNLAASDGCGICCSLVSSGILAFF